MPALHRLVTDELGLTHGDGRHHGSPVDFGARRWIGDTVLDTAFTELRRDPDGMARVKLDDMAGGRGITVSMDERF